MTDPDDKMLEDLFAEARAVQPAVDAGLMARVLADAQAVQTEMAAPRPFPEAAKRGLVERFMEMIGGWPAASGLVAATLAGVWVGVAPPETVDALTASMLGDEITIGLMTDLEMFDTGFLVDG